MQERHHVEHMVDEHDTKLPVLPDDEFHSEDGVWKGFCLFNSGEFLFHIHGRQEERTPSAKTLNGGFHCFGCNQTFGVPATNAMESTYPFIEEEIYRSTEPDAYLPDINWHIAMKKKFFVVSVPMGSGKMEQVKSLINEAQDLEKV